MPNSLNATVFYHDAGEASAKVYAVVAPQIDGRAATAEELADCRLECRIEGPTCRYSTTLTARVPLRHRGPTSWGDLPAIAAEGVLPDPCAWTSELPFLYRVVGTVRIGEQAIGEINQTFGIRPLAAVKRRIVLNGKTWVPRIVNRAIVHPPAALSEWRETATTLSVVEPDEALCREADEIGVSIVAGVRHGRGRDGVATLRRLSRHPSVVLAMVESVEPLPQEFRTAARNTLRCSWQPLPPSAGVFDATDVFVATGHEVGLPGNVWESGRPVIVFSPIQEARTLEQARARCDEFQAQLAGKCDPAGYLV